jgi:hypothetical protein
VLQFNQIVQQRIKLREFFCTDGLFQPVVVRFNRVRQPLHQLQALGRGLDHRAALVLWVTLACNQAVAFHACQHASQAGAKDARLTRNPPSLHAAMLAQHPQHPPLRIRQAVDAQARAVMRHHGFTGLQQQAGKVAVGEGLGHGVGFI